MHVVQVIVGLSVGGAELMLRRLVLAQLDAVPGMRCTVVSLTTVGPVGDQLRQAGVPVVALGMRSPLSAIAALWRLRQLIARQKPDLVQTWMVHADLIGGLAARTAGVPAVVWGIRTTDFSTSPLSTRAVRWLCARLSRLVPHTIVCAAEASRRAHVAYGYDAGRMLVIPNGFELDRLKPDAQRGHELRLRLGVSPAQVLIGCVGRYNAAKDHANFVRAAGLLAASHADCRFLMVGRDVEGSNAALKQLVDATGHGDRFLLVGEQGDVPAWLDAMDMFVLPSQSEGFPNVLGEAMAMGLPCVSTDVGDAAWLLGDAGLVVPPQDAQALSDAMRNLMSLPRHELQALGQRARQRLTSGFSMQQACDRFTRLHEQVVSEVQHSRKRSG
jgi:glycosyltransferase involved in cell wall biosynthesis